ncbi:hypothetical protein [Paraburkholderia sp. 32]|uniref:hypothetical protein n=1 Tax=Paraburkholderia sp. 32 TaxID=2991057 RepID=UPI003D193807
MISALKPLGILSDLDEAAVLEMLERKFHEQGCSGRFCDAKPQVLTTLFAAVRADLAPSRRAREAREARETQKRVSRALPEPRNIGQHRKCLAAGERND